MTISLDNCKDRVLYKLEARNILKGVFNAKTKSFLGVREKFGDEYLDGEYHYDCGPPFGTAIPIAEIAELPPEIVNAATLGSLCRNCKQKVSWSREHGWLHCEPTDCNRSIPVAIDNRELFDWIKSQ